ncbi:DUF2252 domain-containing protein [Exiguobacterium flavidum]|uniref:DUF2252 domain-containing protein n=1 Tax=Exiguobacterium flavidum TaxID=2184695 RepID=UPI000DF8356A|nr:DUF2252 family protein [Exiguobacterium flavidum]
MFEEVYAEIRKTTIAKVLDFYDGTIRQLDEEGRQAKYAKMLESPFRFFRGSSHLFYYDVTRIPLAFDTPVHYPTWIQGDLHFENFGVHGNALGEVVYDVNDFDEGYLGSYLYDVLRMAVSVQLFAEECGHDPRAGIEAFCQSYLDQLRLFAQGAENPRTFSYTKGNTKGPVKKLIKKAEKKQAELLAERTELHGGERRFKQMPDMVPVDETTLDAIRSVWPSYIETIDEEDRQTPSFYKIKDVVTKIESGTASIGLKRFYILIEGEGGEHADTILEMKQAQSPVPALFLPAYRPEVETVHQGLRIVATQKAMQAHEDTFLGYMTMKGEEFYVRERSPFKKKLKAKHISDAKDLLSTLAIQGKITAKIHARADADSELLAHHADQMIVSSIGKSDQAFISQVSRSAEAYARRVREDFKIFQEWAQSRQR